jgi:hypothetical protein
VKLLVNTVEFNTVEFVGSNESGDGVTGSIDRVTGDLEAIAVHGARYSKNR